MIIQHNIPATNAYRNLISNRSYLSKNLEKLSAGYRINRAADDAAGLAISEAMRSKINGLEQATANANDAIGLIQTEEGALTETHSMLQRMTTLATQAANGTYNSTARASIQKEMNELGDEIDRIANNTNYNGIKPLAADSNKDVGDENNSNKLNMTMQIGPTKGEVLDLKGQDMTLKGIFKSLDTISQEDIDCIGSGKILLKPGDASKNELVKLFTQQKTNNIEAGKSLENALKLAISRAGKKYNTYISVSTSGTVSLAGGGSIFSNPKILMALYDAYDALDGVQKCKGSNASIMSDGKEYIQITSSDTLFDDVESNANRVIQNIQSAIDHVSSYRAELGAKQNRLEHTINNLQVTSENTIAAESRIRDTDMAKEMAAYTKNNILSQAAQSMLAQANQTGQGVLSLLQ
uniref:flagellin N-terminal helical domain-containing protein n=1 Tax=Eubacterium cellulosolvens TaxID=29322 RepID=UPI00048895E0|nr:flagellin [[Eubacterium] cellulosolvens]